MQDLHGKVAVVTGGASGIGLALAKRFADAGMKLALVDIEKAALDEVSAAFESGGTQVLPCEVDVGNADAMDALAEDVLSRFGAVHLVCNNAGVASGGPMWELTTADWEFAMRPNLWGVIHGVRVFGPHLVRQNEGHFVNTASMAGLVSVPGMGPYNVTKHAVVTLSETLYGDLAAQGSHVGVSVLCPGFVSTRIWDSDRNRPDALQNAEQRGTEEERALAREMMKAFIESAMDPTLVADRVHDAVTQNRFYVFTHENTEAAVRQRMEAILDGKQPVTPGIESGVFNPR